MQELLSSDLKSASVTKEKKEKKHERPELNPEPLNCEHYIIHKYRFCKFPKVLSSNFCQYHQENENKYMKCPLDGTHVVAKEKLKKHLEICNKTQFQNKLKENFWYKKNINFPNNGFEITIEKTKELKWEGQTSDVIAKAIDKILKAYEVVEKDYFIYTEDILKKHGDIPYQYSAINARKEILFNNNNISRGLKDTTQTEAILKVLEHFKLVADDIVYVEFGAGKGGLSNKINTENNGETFHILLEREGVRNKKDKTSDNIIRFRTDILDFDINTIPQIMKEKTKVNEKAFTVFGIAKHICGCALDLSLQCLNNIEDPDKFKGLCFATCCHHLSEIKYIKNIDFYTNYLGLSELEIILLFKATSWYFGPIVTKIEEEASKLKTTETEKVENEVKKEKNKAEILIEEKGLTKRYLGLISKYIIDQARVNLLIKSGFNVYYVKYCENTVTPENNLLIAIKK